MEKSVVFFTKDITNDLSSLPNNTTDSITVKNSTRIKYNIKFGKELIVTNRLKRYANIKMITNPTLHGIATFLR